MRKILKKNLILLIIGLGSAQFRLDVPAQSIPTNLNGELDSRSSLSLFDPGRFNIDHGFTIQMMNLGGHSISMAGYNNHITYWAMNNLKLDANITLYQNQSPLQQQGPLINQLDIAYDAGLIYQPTKNSIFQLRIQNIPYYQRHQISSPFNSRMIK